MHYINIPFPYVQTHTNKHSALNLEEEIEIILHCPKWSRISYTVSAHFMCLVMKSAFHQKESQAELQ